MSSPIRAVANNRGPPIMQTKRPNVGTLDDAITIVDNDTYLIKDLFLKNERGVTEFTISMTILHPMRNTTGHSHGENHETYTFTQGRGFMNLQGDPIFVVPGTHVFISPGQWHQVVNYSEREDLVFLCHYPGEIQRKHLLK
jgi:mannose-6-phosphate isomerase-like protein (cupin superfamily)